MKLLKLKSINDKLVVIILLISISVLVLGFGFMTYNNVQIFRAEMVDNVNLMARVIGDYSVSELVFNDREAAESTLSRLQAIMHIQYACLYDTSGDIFAEFVREPIELPKGLVLKDGLQHFDDQRLHFYQSVRLLNEVYGGIYICASTEHLTAKINEYIATQIIILILSILFTLFLARRMQHILTGPILDLADTANKITEDEDFGRRVERESDDEIGTLYDSFNEMLEHIEARDIARNDALNALSESEDRYRQLVEMSPNSILVHANDKILFANKQANQLIGFDPSKTLAGSDIFDFIHPDYHDLAKHRIEQMMISNKPAPLVEQKFICEDGTVISGEVISVPMNFNKQPAILVVIQDITERKQTEQALRQSELRQRHIIEQSQDALYVIQNSKFVMVNPRFIELFGYTKEEILSPDFNIMMMVHEDSQSFIMDRKRKSERGEFVPSQYGFKGISKDGDTFELEVNLSKITWDGNPAIMGILRDVTSQRVLEEQLRQSQKMEAVGTLAGGVAHDFNNILTVISGQSELALLKIPVDDPIVRHISEIKKAGQRAQNLTRQLLAFSRKQIIELKTVNLNNVINDMAKMLIRLIGENINLNIELSDNISAIKADPGQIEQILMNLVVNARDAILANPNTRAKKEITIETANVYLDDTFRMAHSGSKVGPHVSFSVTDTGAGMDEEIQEKIFEPFFTTKGIGKGTGLGLSTTYGIVKQNQGSIYVYSEVGQGTSFRIYWPQSLDDAVEMPEKNDESEIPRGKETILFVEDDDGVREFTGTALGTLGYAIHEAANAKIALDLVQKKKLQFDLLITDLVMPEISGKELADELSQKIEGLKVLFTSGYTQDNIVHNGILDTGINFLHKPFSVQQLSQKIRTVLDDEEIRYQN